jgi:diaminohydroxyphosphoribosylaminopyrimidine deaminase / 5-amino-6-(5-phosphoribosylamino)uracil reductase
MSEQITQPELYMQRAFELAELGRETVSPNPMVGCVIVYNDKIIGEGYHLKYGQEHAEVNAIASVNEPDLLPQATAYVSLEPCSHYGKTPPCTHLLVEKGIRKVVIANIDPNPEVAGNGIKYLEQNGAEVTVGLLADRGEKINERFFKSMRSRQPYIILKWAQTADGYISNTNKSSVKITNALMDMQSHRWRAEEDAILVGMQTVLSDNPSLNVRHWPSGKNPIRIVLANKLPVNLAFKVFDDSQDTLVFCTENPKENALINFTKTEFVLWPLAKIDLDFLLNFLNQKKIRSILVEGGAKTLNNFIETGLYDEIRLLKNKNLCIKDGTIAPKIPHGIAFVKQQDIEDNILSVYKRNHSN